MKEFLLIDSMDNKIVAIYTSLAKAQSHKHLVEDYADYYIMTIG